MKNLEKTLILASMVTTMLIAVSGRATPPLDNAIINGAAAALGGAERIQAVNTLVLEGAGENGYFNLNVRPYGPLPVYAVSDYKYSLDLANNRARLQQTRAATWNTSYPGAATQILCVDGDVAFNLNQAGNATRQRDLVATYRRLDIYNHPIAAVRAALAKDAHITKTWKDGSNDAVDITTSRGDRFSLVVDGKTRLPLKVLSMTDSTVLWQGWGDVVNETTFSDYDQVDGLQLPARVTTRWDKFTLADIRISKTTINGDTGNLAAPDKVRAEKAPPNFEEPTFEPQRISDSLWLLESKSEHSVIVEFADYLVLVDAPQNDVFTGTILAKAKEIKPNKPIRYVINTHHHLDHAGGLRRIMAEDITIITHEMNKEFYEEMARRPHTIIPDELSKRPRKPRLELIADGEKRVMTDGSRTLEIYPITANEHANDLLMVYFPAERIITSADVFDKPRPRETYSPNFVSNVRKWNLRVDRFMEMQGPIVPWSDVEHAALTEINRLNAR